MSLLSAIFVISNQHLIEINACQSPVKVTCWLIANQRWCSAVFDSHWLKADINFQFNWHSFIRCLSVRYALLYTLFHAAYLSYYCNMVGFTWWDWSL